MYLILSTHTIRRVTRVQGSHPITLCFGRHPRLAINAFLGSNRTLLEDLLATRIMSETYKKALTLPTRSLLENQRNKVVVTKGVTIYGFVMQ
jgi:hypothetical protein